MNEEQLLASARQEFLVQKYVESKVAPKVTVTRRGRRRPSTTRTRTG